MSHVSEWPRTILLLSKGTGKANMSGPSALFVTSVRPRCQRQKPLDWIQLCRLSVDWAAGKFRRPVLTCERIDGRTNEIEYALFLRQLASNCSLGQRSESLRCIDTMQHCTMAGTLAGRSADLTPPESSSVSVSIPLAASRSAPASI